MTTHVMPAADDSGKSSARLVDEAYRFCRAVAHEHGANFSVGFRFLPKQKRQSVYAAYAFCRWADDIADSPGTDIPRRLDEWQKELESCYAGQPKHTITVALADSLRHFPIPKSAFIALIEGCRQDLVKTRYETFEELLHYCDLVATSISDISLSIFGYRDPRAPRYGQALATALQLTNVTRDIGDDLDRDRIYIPRTELHEFSLSDKDLLERRRTEAMRRMVSFQIERAKRYFREAEPLLKQLSFDARFPTLLMGSVYVTVLSRLEKDPLLALGPRISLSLPRKLSVVLSRVVSPHFL